MKLLKGQYPIRNKDEIQEILHNIYGKRIEVFDLRTDALSIGEVESVGTNSFRFRDDTGVIKSFGINDVEIKA